MPAIMEDCFFNEKIVQACTLGLTDLSVFGIRPRIVLEQAVEKGTPKTMATLEAFRKSEQYRRDVFGAFA